ncbi:MAG: hypothetical protein ACOYB3_02140 [Azonexus sp.]
MFTITPDMFGGFHVEGTDATGKSGATILESPAWERVLTTRAHKEASQVFDAAALEFFKPLTDAAEQAKAIAHPSTNPWSEVTIDEGIQGVAPVKVKLDRAGTILRLLDETDGSMLRWVGDNILTAVRP